MSNTMERLTTALAELCARAPREPTLPTVRGLLAALLGDEERAAAAFSEALERRDPQPFQNVHLDVLFPKVRALRALNRARRR